MKTDSCNACALPTPAAELSLSAAGQSLCRACYAKYQVMEATKKARGAQCYRRCGCGKVLSPVEEREERDRHDLMQLFRAQLYSCSSCTRRFRIEHSFLLWMGVPALVGALVSFFRYETTEQRFTAAAAVVMVMGWLGLELTKRMRCPRVR